MKKINSILVSVLIGVTLMSAAAPAMETEAVSTFFFSYELRMGEDGEYADANGLIAIDSIDDKRTGIIVNYPETPLVLTPEVRNFFYGENADERFCDFDYAEDAPDYGFNEWHLPCSQFCAMQGWYDIEATSTLASSDGRYEAENLRSSRGRSCAWSEGVDGPGIGESITYRDSMSWSIPTERPDYEWNQLEYSLYGYKRYTEICIVNGYAKNQKTWEENGRVKTLLLYVEDKPYAYLELEDTIFPQYFALPEEDIKVSQGDEITFRFVIEEVYSGTVYEDTCLTGLVMEFTGRHGH